MEVPTLSAGRPALSGRGGRSDKKRRQSAVATAVNLMSTFLQDIRYGFRMLLKHKGFTAVAILALGLGIGANTAIFSLVNGVLLRPLQFPNAERIVYFEGRNPTAGSNESNSSYPD